MSLHPPKKYGLALGRHVRVKIVISCRVQKSGPFRTRFSGQREVFFSRCPFFGPGETFSHGKKNPEGPKLDSGRKKHSRRTEKKEFEKWDHFLKRGAEKTLFYSSI